MDFYRIDAHQPFSNNRKYDFILKPDFIFSKTQDLICKGGDMYAFWNGTTWDTSLENLVGTIDRETIKQTKEVENKNPGRVVVSSLMNNNSSQIMKEFRNYTKLKQQSNVIFNSKILFSEDTPKREDYSTTQLTFTPTAGPTPAFDELVDVLYEPEEFEKIMWFIGALFTNSMDGIEKFMYLYGGKGSGKGTIIKVIKMLFQGYYAPINLQQLTSKSEFATSQIREVPLLIDDDSDMSKIQDDTNLLKLTSHDPIIINAKYKQEYEVVFKGLLITASNQRFKVRNVDSGITRRAIVVEPTNKTHPGERYTALMELVKYELPMIAQAAVDVFNRRGRYYYDGYMNTDMIAATDHIYAFVLEVESVIENGITLKQVAELYKLYLEDIGYDTKGYKRVIKEELKRYYHKFFERTKIGDTNYYNYYDGFRKDRVDSNWVDTSPAFVDAHVDDLDSYLGASESKFDLVAKDYPAQLANSKGIPTKKWDDVKTTLDDVDTTELHFVMVPMNHIVIDFDVKNEHGEKDLARNVAASKKFPPTYTELSKSGEGVHLHYIYNGDVSKLASLYEDDIEIKVFTGKSSLRRKLTKCNDLDIAHITTGLPLKEREGVTVYKDVEIITWNEKKMRTAVKGNLSKKYHANTKPSVDFIVHIFEQAEKEGVKYDLRDMRQDVLAFAASSKNNSQYCVQSVSKLNYCTIDQEVDTMEIQTSNHIRGAIVPDEELYFYDVEVFSNLFIVVFKKYGEETYTKWINPTSSQIEELVSKPLVGFNNRRYDNHILYARLLGEDNDSLYRQSQRIINANKGNKQNGMYSGGYELSYADIYEYSSKKQSLKKWEVELGITHDELELPWDQPVEESMWERVADYCVNDVMATEAVFKATYYDYTARKILTNLSGLSVNATTTQQAAKFLFGEDKKPQEKFEYVDLSETFPGYKFEFGKSEYKGINPGEGGYVYAEPGIYRNVAVLDVASMHPYSLIAMNHFGPYTKVFENLVQARIHIKHKEFGEVRKMFGGSLVPFLEDESKADELSYAMKIIINIVYGMTSAKFENKFKHPKNVDNIVAKRGALFMIDLKEAVEAKGFQVVHIKTDSIKIPDATPEIIQFVSEFGNQYGYSFDHEATYESFALVNKAVYISKIKWALKEKLIGTWEAVGAQFADPYVFKTLFSKEEIVEDDYALTKQATAPIYLGDRFVGKLAQVYASLSGEEMWRVTEDKKGHVTGTKGYAWRLTTEYQGKDDIDMRYYDGIVNTAEKSISRVGDPKIIFGDDYKLDEEQSDS